MSSQCLSLNQLRKQWLSNIIEAAQKAPPFIDLTTQDEADEKFWTQLNELQQSDRLSNDDFETGQAVLCRIVSHFPHLMPYTARDLFWLFGGDCLHFMPDDEITFFQRLDERRYECESEQIPFDYLTEKNKLESPEGGTLH